MRIQTKNHFFIYKIIIWISQRYVSKVKKITAAVGNLISVKILLFNFIVAVFISCLVVAHASASKIISDSSSNVLNSFLINFLYKY